MADNEAVMAAGIVSLYGNCIVASSVLFASPDGVPPNSIILDHADELFNAASERLEKILEDIV
jgi:hypothetical protein